MLHVLCRYQKPLFPIFLSSLPPSSLSCPSHTGDKPTLRQLVNMKLVDGKPLNVTGQIATNYYNFGMNLLQDENGVEVAVIERDHKGAEAITRAILMKWLRDGGPTCTYQYLVECLEESGLRALADEISGQLGREEVHERVSHCRSCSQYISIVSTGCACKHIS